MSALASLHAGSALSYLIALVIPALDAIFPVLPGETAVIALGASIAISAVIEVIRRLRSRGRRRASATTSARPPVTASRRTG